MGRDGERERLIELRETVARHNDRYYNRDDPAVSDAEYDRLYDELVGLEGRHPEWFDPGSPTQLVGGVPSPSFEPVAHREPMLSLEKAAEEPEVLRFFERCRKELPDAGFLAAPKIDGLAVSLLYRDGAFAQGATRGDGETGEDISASLRVVSGVLRELPAGSPAEVEVRGEVFMSREAFERVNRWQRELGEKEFVNPRNCAAGTVRQKDVRLTARRGLEFRAYWAIVHEGEELSESALGTFEALKEMGFGVSEPFETVGDGEGFVRYRETVFSEGDGLGYDIDGIVLRLDHTPTALAMGSNAKSPRAMLAYKFPSERAKTRVDGIDFQVSRSGVLTPVARLKGVRVGGVTVTSVTLHNCQMLEDMDVRIGDEVVVVRAGDVIPKVVGVNKERRQKGSVAFTLPEECPECGGKLRRTDINLVCGNEGCSGRRLERLRHFVSRHALDIEGFGDERLRKLMDEGLVKRPADIFVLRQEEMKELERLKDKSAANLEEAVKRASRTTLARALVALGIPGLGTTGARALAEASGSLAALENAMPETLCFVGPVNYATACELRDSLRGEEGEELRLMRERGVSWDEPGPRGMSAGALELLTHVNYLSDAAGRELWPRVPGSLVEALRSGRIEAASVDGLLDAKVVAKAYSSEKKAAPALGLLQGLSEASGFKDLVRELGELLGVTWGADRKDAGKLAGKGVLVTGSLPGHDRNAAKDMVTRHGGVPKEAVTGAVDLLVVGERPGKTKVDKAQALGVRTMAAAEFLKWLGEGGK